MFRAIQISGLAWALAASGAWAQRPGQKAGQAVQKAAQKADAPRTKAAAVKAPANQAALNKAVAAKAGISIDGPGMAALDRWNRMTPNQRDKALAKLPPERQRAIRERLDRWNKMPPQEKERLRARYDRFSHLPADRQALLRRQIQNFARLPDDRRPTVSREFDSLRRLPENDRRARINSEEFRNRFSPREQEMLRDLAENMAIPSNRQPVQASR